MSIEVTVTDALCHSPYETYPGRVSGLTFEQTLFSRLSSGCIIITDMESVDKLSSFNAEKIN